MEFQSLRHARSRVPAPDVPESPDELPVDAGADGFRDVLQERNLLRRAPPRLRVVEFVLEVVRSLIEE